MFYYGSSHADARSHLQDRREKRSGERARAVGGTLGKRRDPARQRRSIGLTRRPDPRAADARRASARPSGRARTGTDLRSGAADPDPRGGAVDRISRAGRRARPGRSPPPGERGAPRRCDERQDHDRAPVRRAGTGAGRDRRVAGSRGGVRSAGGCRSWRGAPVADRAPPGGRRRGLRAGGSPAREPRDRSAGDGPSGAAGRSPRGDPASAERACPAHRRPVDRARAAVARRAHPRRARGTDEPAARAAAAGVDPARPGRRRSAHSGDHREEPVRTARTAGRAGDPLRG